jgi:hypothetical protein
LAIIGGLAAALALSKGNFLQKKLEPNVQPTLVTPLVQVDPVLQESLDDQLAKNALLQNQLNESLSTEFQLNQLEQQFGKLFTREEKQVDITKSLWQQKIKNENYERGISRSGRLIGGDERFIQDMNRWLRENRTIETQSILTPVQDQI